MPEPSDRGFAGRLWSVRLRITLVATLVTGMAVLLASTWLVDSVRDSMTDRLQGAAGDRLAEVRRQLEDGRDPAELDLSDLGPDVVVQVVDGRTGAVVAGNPNVSSYPALYTTDPAGGIVRIDPDQAALILRGHGGASLGQVGEGPGFRYRLVAGSPLDTVRRSVDAVQEGLLVAFPLLVASVGILAWVLAGRALHPVESIRAQVEAITASTLDRRVPVPRSGDEVARLAATMNAMLDRLEDASTRQQRFVADASHELRSPVAAIRTELEVAQRTAGPEDWPAVAERLLGEEARLEAVISDLFLLASLDEGAAGEHVPVDLAEVAGEEARRRAPGREGITIEVDAPAAAIVDGNRTQLRRAVTNLLDNAGRHARTTVRVGVHARDGRVRLLVDDDGPGIPETDRERAFERFTRLDDHRSRDGASGGSGLGLSLVRRIAQRHDGTATIGTAPLGGARVVLDLPGRAPT